MALLLPCPDVSNLTVRHRCLDVSSRNAIATNMKCLQRISIMKSENGNGHGGVRVRVGVSCSSVKDLEVNLGTASPSKQSKDEEEKRNYYLNTGYAIRTLREEFPALFYKELDFDIYRDDIVFKDPLNTFVGIEYYKSIFWALRFHGRLFFRALWIDIISVRQAKENTILVRWTVHGIPRVPWDTRGCFDGTSEYKLDKNGKIYEHRVYNIILNAPPKYHVISVQELIQAMGCPSMPKPTYFEISSCSVQDSMPTIILTFIRHQIGSIVSRALRLEGESSRRS